MKLNKTIIAIIAFLALFSSNTASAQYYEAVNALRSIISPALSGSGGYKGIVEAGYTHTLGKYNGDFVEFSTSQGYQYNNWFFMGAGLGVDVLLSTTGDNWGSASLPPNYRQYTTKAVMLPLFSDFRFLIGNQSNVSFFLDLKIGCSFLLGNKCVAISDGFLTNREYFFLDPAIGIKIPVSKKKPKMGVDVGVRYKLLTSNYWYVSNNNITLQSLGAFVGFEW